MRLFLIAILALAAAPLAAAPPRVVADIAPVHALVAQVMEGVAEPDLLLAPGLTPHHAALRPSQARALQAADLVVWIGPELTPWLDEAMNTLAADAARLDLLDSDATHRLPFRETGDDHDHGHGHHDTDPHAWLDPRNGAAWLGIIAQALAARDPGNAASYRANAVAGQARLATLEADLDAMLAPVRDRPFIAQHDAYQYFEARFGLTLAGTVASGEAAGPGPARLATLRVTVAEQGVACAFREPQYSDRLLLAATEGMGVALAVLDPLGSGHEPGPTLYAAILTDMAETFATCGGD